MLNTNSADDSELVVLLTVVCEEGEVGRRCAGTDREEKSEVRDGYSIVSDNFSDGRKCAGEDVGLSKARPCEELTCVVEMWIMDMWTGSDDEMNG